MKKSKKVINIISRIVGSLLAITFMASFLFLFFINTIPLKYSIPFFIVMLFIVYGLFDLLFEKKIRVGIKVTLNAISTVFIVVFIYAITFMNNTVNFLDLIKAKNNKEVYYVVALKDSNYDTLETLKNTNIAVYNSGKDTVDKAILKLKENIDFKETLNSDLYDISDKLFNNGLSSILIESSFLEVIKEQQEDFELKTKVIYEFTIDVLNEVAFNKVNSKNESFNIYISGIDSYGSLSTVSRSDVNIVASINPKTNEILLTNIPRDYYVYLRDKPSMKDKLTHAGLYGVESSVGTIEDLLDIDIHYYVRLNFTSVVGIVNDLGGITVNSKYAFRAQSGHYFKKGLNKLNGEAALGFVRERKKLPGGDRTRGENQQEAIRAILEKATTPSILLKYNSIFEKIGTSFETNMSKNEIFNLVKKQLDDNKAWNINSFSLNGTDSSNYTFTYGREKLYVMEPDLTTIEEAKILIAKTLSNDLQ